jgi:hypothetical protein
VANFCNKTTTYQTFDDNGNWQTTASSNRCYGASCFSDSQCSFAHTKKLQCQNATCDSQACNASYVYSYYLDESETKKASVAAENRCAYVPCESGKHCQTGMCFNGTCLNQFQKMPSCNASMSYNLFSEETKATEVVEAINRCLYS